MSENISPSEHLAEVQATFDARRPADRRDHEGRGQAPPRVHRGGGAHPRRVVRRHPVPHRVGQKCDDVRQEFILLSDTLGASMLVEMINHAAADGTTEPTVFGPFHVDGSPVQGVRRVDRRRRRRRARSCCGGRSRTSTASPIAGATLDVWEVGSNGLYDVQDDGAGGHRPAGAVHHRRAGPLRGPHRAPGRLHDPRRRPRRQDAAGHGPPPWRPAHVHLVASAPGYKSVTTHAFDTGSDYLDSDAVFGVRRSLVVDMDGGEAVFDIVLDRA